MKVNHNPIIFIALFISLNGFSQANDALNEEMDIKLLLGQWDAFKKTTLEGSDGSEITLSGKPYTVKLELDFVDNNRVYFNNGEGKIELDYMLNKDTLKVSHFIYTIVNLSRKEMVLKQEKLLGGLIYLKKVGD